MRNNHFLSEEHELFESAITDAMHSCHSKTLHAKDRAMIRKIAAEWLLRSIRRGERDRSRLARGAIACLQQAFQGADSDRQVSRDRRGQPPKALGR
jgi:hypothetical protein